MMPDSMSEPELRNRSGLQIQAAAIRALFLRELQTRFGRYRLGYIWAVLEPGLHVATMVLLFGAVLHRSIPGMEYPLFLVNGILPWFMIARSATKALGAVAANKGLFNYRPVLPIDSVIARTALEGVLYFNIYMISMVLLWWTGYDISFSNIPLIVLTWGLLWLFALGFSMIMMVLGDLSQEVSKFVPVGIRILYFTSGILYSLHAIPQKYLPYILWNPVPHALETMRHAVDPEYPMTHVSYSYFVMSVLVMLVFGLLVYKARERQMVTSA
jgi:capsular polysaccharide transport system permease protein